MRNAPLFLFLFVIVVPGAIKAQIIGDDAIRNLQQNGSSIVQGEIVAFLEDTTSPEYFRSEFARMDIEITSEWVQNLMINIVNSPADSILSRLAKHPSVHDLEKLDPDYDIEKFEASAKEMGLSGSDLEEAKTRFMNMSLMKMTMVEFKYSVAEEDLYKIMDNFRSVAYDITTRPVRQVNLKTVPGKEEDVMKLVEQLPFVKSTAFIGMIEN